jgi:hypothetical protein
MGGFDAVDLNDFPDAGSSPGHGWRHHAVVVTLVADLPGTD